MMLVFFMFWPAAIVFCLLFWDGIRERIIQREQQKKTSKYIDRYMGTEERKAVWVTWYHVLLDAKYPDPDSNMNVIYRKLKYAVDLFGLENLLEDGEIDSNEYSFLKEMLETGRVPKWVEPESPYSYLYSEKD